MTTFPALNCVVTFDELSRLDFDVPLAELREQALLADDMFQGSYAGGLILDVSWREIQSTSIDGVPYAFDSFVIALVKNQDWEVPVVRWLANSFDELLSALKLIDGWVVLHRLPSEP
jgi:hypothetical protein